LIIATRGKACVQLYRRSDGTVLTRDCPVGIARVRRRVARVLAGFAAVLTFAFTGLRAAASGDLNSSRLKLGFFRPFAHAAAFLRSLNPPPPPTPVAGDDCLLLGGAINVDVFVAELRDNREFALRDPKLYLEFMQGFGTNR
jgi:hypothetical protein